MMYPLMTMMIEKIHQHVTELFTKIQAKYDQYGIEEKPLSFKSKLRDLWYGDNGYQ